MFEHYRNLVNETDCEHIEKGTYNQCLECGHDCSEDMLLKEEEKRDEGVYPEEEIDGGRGIYGDCPHDWEDGYCLDCGASYYEVVISPRLD